jgi:hypothetical protein
MEQISPTIMKKAMTVVERREFMVSAFQVTRRSRQRSPEDETSRLPFRSSGRTHFLVKIVTMQRAEKLILRLVAGVVEIDGLAGNREAFLAVQPDAALGAPGIERSGKNIDIIGTN